MVKNENQSVFENFFAIEIGGLLFAFSNIHLENKTGNKGERNWIC